MQKNGRQHGKMFFDLIRNGIHGDKLVIYTLIYDRMQSSITRDAFYDKKVQRHYVIYTVKELADFIGISDRTVGKFIKELTEGGYLKIKRQFSKANKIFIPDFNEEAVLQELKERRDYNDSINENNSVPYTKNIPTNHTDFKQTNQQYNTRVNTRNCQKNTKNQDGNLPNVSFESWIESTAHGYSMNRVVPETVAKYAQYFDDPKDVAYKFIGTISRVRGFIAKKFKVKGTELSQFDSNANFGVELADKVRSVMSHVIAKKIKDLNQVLAYLNKSLQNFFTQAMGKGISVARPTFAPDMGDESANYVPRSKAKKHQGIIPQWMKDEEEGIDREEKPTILESLEIKAKLLEFDDGIKRDYENVINPKIKSLMAKYGIGLDDRVPADNNSELSKLYKKVEMQVAAF
ncbi:hypothetical protein ACYATP_00030 [Lactobacillaceae bacterium Melli_B4]